jgi:hypothetical protein
MQKNISYAEAKDLLENDKLKEGEMVMVQNYGCDDGDFTEINKEDLEGIEEDANIQLWFDPKPFVCPKCGKLQDGFKTYAAEFYYWERDLDGTTLDSDFLDSEEYSHHCNDCEEDITDFVNDVVLKGVTASKKLNFEGNEEMELIASEVATQAFARLMEVRGNEAMDGDETEAFNKLVLDKLNLLNANL